MLGDYYFQNSKLADEKESALKAVIMHGLYYGLTMMLTSAVLFLFGNDWKLFLTGFALSALHLAVDLFKFSFNSKNKVKESNSAAITYMTDQLTHWVAVFIIIELLYTRRLGLAVSQPAPREMAKWVLLLLLILKPGNVTHKKLFHQYEPKLDDADTQPGAGALIGSLERILCAIFLALGQYSAIGLIYTAKSIARFKKISEVQRFAEYYLIGTLYSILFVLAAYLVIFKFIP